MHTNPGKKNQHAPFFSKISPLSEIPIPWGIEFHGEFPMEPWRPIFEKCSHLREKGGVLMILKTTHQLEAKAQYSLRVWVECTRGLSVRSYSRKWRVILLTHCPQICVRKEISRPSFLNECCFLLFIIINKSKQQITNHKSIFRRNSKSIV
jgi:hypothetical protein